MTGSVRRIVAGIVAVLAAVTMLVGCSRTVEGTAAKAGSGDVPRNDNSEKQYPNLLKECEVLTEDILAKTEPRGSDEAEPADKSDKSKKAAAKDD